MTFDIVVGNPPYNNDAYLPFVTLGKNISNISCMITPSKWIAKSSDMNDRFRENVLNNISDIVYYPDTREIFDISVPDGISYYLIDNNNHEIKTIKNICSKQKYFNGTEQRKIENHINNMANKIVNKVKSFKEPTLVVSSDRTYFIKANTQLYDNSTEDSVKVFGGDSDGTKLLYGYLPRNYVINHQEDIDKHKVVIQFKFGNGIFTLDNDGRILGLKNLNIYEPTEICKDDYLVIYTADNVSECENYKSYLYTKLIRFLIYAGCVGPNASNMETWRFVPDQIEYNHIYSDNEIYEKYKLTDDEIRFIEYIMKERT